MWKVSGEGSGGVSRAFGEDLWDLVDEGAEQIGEKIDKSSPQKTMESFEEYIIGTFKAADSLDFSINDGTVEITIKGCKFHDYTDYLEMNNVPRSAGCPFALVCIALLEEVTGDPFFIDKIESENANSKIVLKTL